MIPTRPTKGWIGCNIRPGMHPGGFSTPKPKETVHFRSRKNQRDQVIEAANRVLEGRKVLEVDWA